LKGTIQEWLDIFFSGFRWYRRLVGGKWIEIRITAIPLWLWTRDRPLLKHETEVASEEYDESN
jgi:hypothetical protein